MRRAALGALLVLALAACSGGGRSAADRWDDAATKACDARAQAVQVASAQLTGSSTPEQYGEWFTQFFVPAYRTQLSAMASPPDDTAKALVADTTAVVDAIAADPTSYAQAADPFADVDARWDAYGLVACGSRTTGPGTLSSSSGSGTEGASGGT